ncbi:Ppx/GppA phosphatase family protein [Thermovenabulum gondwanense]|uniref:Exopolyphosphatase n=1 Tax=Thermovenabulum gondwanense TaxID=520767 RepID=A0A162MHQ8_9FIRM|nr:Ppx/GppA phosphatase family protein [Thermovenabulum gondwanense]KYO66090.1 Exopolyphosphatase [Thermovenabulum gondwanense]
MRACIDIGSNSVRLLVAEVNEKKVIPVFKKLTTTRLGSGVAKDGFLREEAVNSTIDAVKEYMGIAKNYGVKKVIAFATSAVREAKNRDEFLKRVKEALGMDVLVIPGEKEAVLSYKGARYGLGLKGKTAVIDIGGGSTEITYGEQIPEESRSFQMGAVRWTQRFLINDPPLKAEMEELCRAEKEMLMEFAQKIHAFSKGDLRAVAVGGTATTACAIKLGLSVYDWKKVHGQILSMEDVENSLKLLCSVPLAERQKIPGLMPERADIIIAGILILKNIMEMIDIDKVIVSEADLMDAILVEG